MNPLYVQALNGTLQSPADNNVSVAIAIGSKLFIPTTVHTVDTFGALTPVSGTVLPGSAVPTFQPGDNPSSPLTLSTEIWSGQYLILTNQLSGAFVAVLTVPSAGQAVPPLDWTLLAEPNDIGPIPQPNAATLIPPDSPRVLVGCGLAPTGNYIVREQYWRRADDSYVLAPNETRTIGFTTTSGMQQISSSEETLQKSVSASVSGGWGPVSATVSASLSSNAVNYQQLTITSESTRFETVKLKNTTTEPQMYLKWQLMDVITVYSSANSAALSCVIIGQSPVIVAGPYSTDPSSLAAPPARLLAAMTRGATRSNAS